MRARSKKGFTLAEMCIVMALIAIVGVQVTSFTIMMRNQSNRSISITNSLEDKEAISDLFARWTSLFDSEQYTFSIDHDKLVATKNADDTDAGQEARQYYLQFSRAQGTIVGTVPGGNNLTIDVSTVSSVSFFLMPSVSGERTISKMTVYYQVYNSSGTDLRRESCCFFHTLYAAKKEVYQ